MGKPITETFKKCINDLIEQRNELNDIIKENIQDRNNILAIIKKFSTKLEQSTKDNFVKILAEIDENIEYSKIFIYDINRELLVISDN